MGGFFDQLSGAKAARVEGKSAQNIATFKAAVAKQRAVAERKKAGFAQKRQVRRGEQSKSPLVARLAAAGGLESPVAADIIAEQAAELDLESMLIGFEGEIAASQAETQAELDILQGRLAKQRGKAAGRAANIRFGTELATLGAAGGLFKGAPKVGTPGTGGGLPGRGGQRFLTGFA